jgi:uncharacterized membrane protein
MPETKGDSVLREAIKYFPQAGLPFGGRSFHFAPPDPDPAAPPAGDPPPADEPPPTPPPKPPARHARGAPPKPQGNPPGDPPPAPAKVEMTEEELEAIRETVRADERERLAAEQKQKDDEAAEKLAKETGDWKKIAEAAEAKRAAEETKRIAAEDEKTKLEISVKTTEVRELVRVYLSEHHRDHVGSEKWIMPQVAFDLKTTPKEITDRIKVAADNFVKENPRKVQPSPPPPPRGFGGGNLTQTPSNGEPRKITGAARNY